MTYGNARRDRRLDMCRTCFYVKHMSGMIQIRNVPDSLHRKLKARAATEGVSLSDYILAELRRMAELPTQEEMLRRLHSHEPVRTRETSEEIIRAIRDSR